VCACAKPVVFVAHTEPARLGLPTLLTPLTLLPLLILLTLLTLLNLSDLTGDYLYKARYLPLVASESTMLALHSHLVSIT
jgi:hypothetical protein